MKSKKSKFKKGDKITFTVLEVIPYFGIMTVKNDITGDIYVSDINAGGPFAWQPKWENPELYQSNR